MAKLSSLRASWTRAMNRLAARYAARTRPAGGLVSQIEPRSIGYLSRGRQMLAGNLMFAGHLIEAPGRSLWEISPPDAAFAEEIHGFVWLDDLAAVGDARARELAQSWLWEWIARYGAGRGPGWTPEQTGRRVIRWVHHALFLLRGQDAAKAQAFYKALAAQTAFVARRGRKASAGLPRFEAMTGLLYAGLSLSGMEAHIPPARAALARECTSQIDETGAIVTRNPEELLEVFTLLTWAQAALEEAQMQPEREHLDAIARIAPVLRGLRHADGALARFHGGGRGLEGRLDHALAASGKNTRLETDKLAMGFVRLSGGRTSAIMDVATPPMGAASAQAHASTLAFELTSGRRPLIVSCGSGEGFGEEWRRAGRASPSHSTLCLAGKSSARLGEKRQIGEYWREWLEEAPRDVPVKITHPELATRIEAGHDGYLRATGLTHARALEMSSDGRVLKGEDYLIALEEAAKKRFDQVMDETRLEGLGYEIRFHLHPDVDVALDMGGQAVSLALASGEIWVLRSVAGMALEPSVYLEKGRLRPRATTQIVLSGRAMQYTTRIRWTLSKASDSPRATRDFVQHEADAQL